MATTERTKKQSKKKSTLFDKVFTLIIQYKETSVFRWVYNHPGLAMGLVALWGILIVVMFMWFVISLATP
ncbi:MAG: hypothetical protein ACUVRK_07945 [Spirochaetota bacterium]